MLPKDKRGKWALKTRSQKCLETQGHELQPLNDMHLEDDDKHPKSQRLSRGITDQTLGDESESFMQTSRWMWSSIETLMPWSVGLNPKLLIAEPSMFLS